MACGCSAHPAAAIVHFRRLGFSVEGEGDGCLPEGDADLAWRRDGTSSGAARKSAVLVAVVAGTALPAGTAAAAVDTPICAAAADFDGPTKSSCTALDAPERQGADATGREEVSSPRVLAGFGGGIDVHLLGEDSAAMEAIACAAAAAIALPAFIALAATDPGLLTDPAAVAVTAPVVAAFNTDTATTAAGVPDADSKAVTAAVGVMRLAAYPLAGSHVAISAAVCGDALLCL